MSHKLLSRRYIISGMGKLVVRLEKITKTIALPTAVPVY